MKMSGNEFMLVFRYEPDTSYDPTEEQKQEQAQLWGQFFGTLVQSGNLVATHELGYEGRLISSGGEVTDGIYHAEDVTMGGYAIVSADSMDQATKLAKSCPILGMGGTVEVRNIVPIN